MTENLSTISMGVEHFGHGNKWAEWTKMYVIGYSDARDVKKTAADRAVRDLQNRVPDMSLEYKPAPTPVAGAAQSTSDSHSD
jgi:hypothetical protein